jgi:hypothetical protein
MRGESAPKPLPVLDPETGELNRTVVASSSQARVADAAADSLGLDKRALQMARKRRGRRFRSLYGVVQLQGYISARVLLAGLRRANPSISAAWPSQSYLINFAMSPASLSNLAPSCHRRIPQIR